jgi:hypothetical protein
VRFISKDGSWARPPIQGQFLQGAIADRAARVLLVPADQPNVVRIFDAAPGAAPVEAHVGFPILGVAIAPNGKGAAAWSREGKAREINALDGSMARPFDLASGEHVETAGAVVDDRGRLTAGLRIRDGSGSWKARVIRVRAGRTLWSTELPLKERSVILPRILVPDDKLVVFWTFDDVRVVRAPQ